MSYWYAFSLHLDCRVVEGNPLLLLIPQGLALVGEMRNDVFCWSQGLGQGQSQAGNKLSVNIP